MILAKSPVLTSAYAKQAISCMKATLNYTALEFVAPSEQSGAAFSLITFYSHLEVCSPKSSSAFAAPLHFQEEVVANSRAV